MIFSKFRYKYSFNFLCLCGWILLLITLFEISPDIYHDLFKIGTPHTIAIGLKIFLICILNIFVLFLGIFIYLLEKFLSLKPLNQTFFNRKMFIFIQYLGFSFNFCFVLGGIILMFVSFLGNLSFPFI